MRFLTKTELQSLPTKRILAYKRKVLKNCRPRSYEDSYLDEDDKAHNRALEQLHQDIAAVLQTREHVPRKVRPTSPYPEPPKGAIHFHKYKGAYLVLDPSFQSSK